MYFAKTNILILIAVLFRSTAFFSQSNEPFILRNQAYPALSCVYSRPDLSEGSTAVLQQPPGQRNISWLERFTGSRFYQITHTAVPMVGMSLIVKGRDDRYRSLRNEYVPKFNYHYDDYLQYAPGALLLGLKACGVDGRSSWGRMAVSDAFSVVTCVALINSLKYSTRVLRPDGTTRNSFPSGHTAVAFMTATMLHKEYGLTRSPWYSVGGYSMAIATGISRQLNNRHWMSDVMMGAAIGIFSTELGYWLADLIFKDKGLVLKNKEYRMFDTNHPPSFLGMSMGITFLINNTRKNDDRSVEVAEGNSVALDGAWFWNRYLGVGGRFGVTSLKLKVDDRLIDDSMDIISLQSGLYFNYPLSVHWALGANVLGGYANIPSYDEDFCLKTRTGGFIWGGGASITYLPARNLGLRGFVHYNYLPTIRAVEMIGQQTVMLGGSVNIMF